PVRHGERHERRKRTRGGRLRHEHLAALHPGHVVIDMPTEMQTEMRTEMQTAGVRPRRRLLRAVLSTALVLAGLLLAPVAPAQSAPPEILVSTDGLAFLS